jgi:hypothetical protein
VKNVVHWQLNKGDAGVFHLRLLEEKEPICIDKDPVAGLFLWLIFDEKGIYPTEELKIHCWKAVLGETTHWFFLDDAQNSLLIQGVTPVCSTEVVPEDALC